MPDLPPPSGFSDPQLAALLDQNKARRRKTTLIFVSVALVVGVVLAAVATYSSIQAKKRRNLAYSRVVKCLFARPLDPGEPPMTRLRAAWRARTLAEPKKDAAASLEDQEAAQNKLWPTRCVPTLMAFTDTLKDLGEMKEGDKDLGYYSRELTKQTAADDWKKKVDAYQATVEAFVSEARKRRFDYVDVPEVEAPPLVDAQPIDVLFPKASAFEDPRLDESVRRSFLARSTRFFVPAGHGKPARLCKTTDGRALACTALDALPPEASGIPWVLPAADGARALLAFGRDGGITSARSVATGLYRVGEGTSLLPADRYYVVGAFTKADGSVAVLLKDAKEPLGDAFEIGRVAPGGAKLAIERVKLTGWNEFDTSVGMAGPYVVWVDAKDELLARSAFEQDAPVTTVATLPGRIVSSRRGPAFSACATKHGFFLSVDVLADGLTRTLVVPVTDGGFGKPLVTDYGTLGCADDAAYSLSDDALATCVVGACKSTKLDHLRPGEVRVALDGVLVRVSLPGGLLRVTWQKDGKTIAEKLYDAQMKGTVLLGESKLEDATFVPRRGYALLFVELGGVQHVARVDGAGNIATTTLVP